MTTRDYQVGDRVKIIDHDPDESPALVGCLATVVGVGRVGLRVRTDDYISRWMWRSNVEDA